VADVKRELGLDGTIRVYTDRHGNQTEMDVSGLKTRTLAGGGKVNTFHQLPGSSRDCCKAILQDLTHLPRERNAFLKTWLDQHWPQTPKQARDLLTQLEAEEQSAEAATDGDGMPF
jgi:hypothetical protein